MMVSIVCLCYPCEEALNMRILISALLLGLFGDKKESKCSTGEELTSSYIPAGLQVVHHYVVQVGGPQEDIEVERALSGASSHPGVPTVIVTYNVKEPPERKNNTELMEKLLKLSSALDEEAAEQDLASCRGITSEVLRQLERSSRMSSRRQLSFILRMIVDGEVKNPKRKDLINEILTQLEDDDSMLSKGLEGVQPLRYLSELSLE